MLENLFNLFKPKVYNDKSMEDDIIEFQNTPYYKVGMYLKLLKNGNNFKSQIISFLASSDEDLDHESIANAGDFIMHTRAWFWISQYDENDKDWLEVFEDFREYDLEFFIILSMKYFEIQEEFEKCALFKSILDILNKN